MEKNPQSFEINLGGPSDPIILETGWKAKQTNGSIWAKQGGTVVLVTAVSGKAPTDYIDFFPLTVNYIEKFYATGRIPGGFFKRETKPSDRETLVARLIDRPLRPMFPDGYRNDTQIIATVVSSDGKNAPDMLALNAASAALMVSDIPFNGPVCGVRVGRKDGELIVNPTLDMYSELDMNIVLAGTDDAIVMVEAGMNNVSEEDVIKALEFGHDHIKTMVAFQKGMREKAGKPYMSYTDYSIPKDMLDKAEAVLKDKITAALAIPSKLEKYEALDNVKKEFLTASKAELGDAYVEKLYVDLFTGVEKKVFRDAVLKTKTRVDGRGLEDIRPIDIELGILPNAHGSALFTRGETQALVILALGSKMDSQMIDDIHGTYYNRFMLHYNFPPFSVGESGPLRAPGRREIGHGALAHRALVPILPAEEGFPYTVRLVSEILESNGSSSMATVCGGSLALMNGGVKTSAPVSGIAMGLIYEKEGYVVLSDILGLEDHLGDMDFKVAGTKDGITALQMDIKIEGLSREILETALAQANKGRMHILNIMNAAISEPSAEMAPGAPRVTVININPEKTGALIGPQGKNIKSIIEETGATIDILDGGVVNIFAASKEAMDAAIARVNMATAEPEEGAVYNAKVKRIMDYGAFVEILPGIEGLLHVSQYSHERIDKISDYLKVGDMVDVKCLGKDRNGRLDLSRKALLEKPEKSGGKRGESEDKDS